MSKFIGMEQLEAVKAIATKEQPRQPTDQAKRRTLPHASPSRQRQSSLLQDLPWDCRLLIWEHVFQVPETSIERWRPSGIPTYERPENIDADCFPYRLCTVLERKRENLLNLFNLLLCCRQSYLEVLPILYSITFVFALPLDLFSFQSYASPEGLARVRSLVIAFGQTDLFGIGPFRSDDPKSSPGTLGEWENVIQGLRKMERLQELRILLGHRFGKSLWGNSPESERRPWKHEDGDQKMEERHHRLFQILGSVNVPNFTLYLTWNPQDILSLRQWPFKVHLKTMLEIRQVQDDVMLGDRDLKEYGWM